MVSTFESKNVIFCFYSLVAAVREDSGSNITPHLLR